MMNASSVRARSRSGDWLRDGVVLSYGLLVVLFVVAALINPNYASWANIRNLMQVGAFIGIIAIGQTLVIILGQIDLSIPWNLTFTAMLMATLIAQGYPPTMAMAIALAVGTLVGVVNAVGTAVFRVHSLVWTLGVNVLLEGATLVYTGAQPPRLVVPDLIRVLGAGDLHGFPVPLIVWIVMGILTILLLRRSRFGRCMYAVGNNETAVFLSGINTRWVYVGAFAISGFCAALAGIMLTGYASQTYLGMGNDYLLIPIAAVVIGGTNVMGGSGGYIGTIAGSLIVVLLQVVLGTVQIQQSGKDIVFGLIVIALVLLYGRSKSTRS